MRASQESTFRFSEKASPIALARGLATLQHEIPQREVLRASSAYRRMATRTSLRGILEALRPDNLLLTYGLRRVSSHRAARRPGTARPSRSLRIDSAKPSRAGSEPSADAAALAVPEPESVHPS